LGDFESSDDGRRTIYKKHNPDSLLIVVVDHLNLTTSTEGRSKKEEIDLISKYAVTLRNKCNVTFFILMQENRNSSNMDRRKAELTECSSEDISDSSAPFQDCEICIGIYYPLKFKLKTHKDYPIIVEGDQNFKGLRGRYRSLQLIKNRQGESEKAIPLNFFGEVNVFRELPKAKEITDYTPYLSLNHKKEEIKDEAKKPKKEIIYKF
jgi:hypothetical protein